MLKEFDFHDLYLHIYMDNLRAKETLFFVSAVISKCFN